MEIPVAKFSDYLQVRGNFGQRNSMFTLFSPPSSTTLAGEINQVENQAAEGRLSSNAIP